MLKVIYHCLIFIATIILNHSLPQIIDIQLFHNCIEITSRNFDCFLFFFENFAIIPTIMALFLLPLEISFSFILSFASSLNAKRIFVFAKLFQLLGSTRDAATIYRDLKKKWFFSGQWENLNFASQPDCVILNDRGSDRNKSYRILQFHSPRAAATVSRLAAALSEFRDSSGNNGVYNAIYTVYTAMCVH